MRCPEQSEQSREAPAARMTLRAGDATAGAAALAPGRPGSRRRWRARRRARRRGASRRRAHARATAAEGRVDHGVHARFAADHGEAADEGERDAVRRDLEGDPAIVDVVGARVGGLGVEERLRLAGVRRVQHERALCEAPPEREGDRLFPSRVGAPARAARAASRSCLSESRKTPARRPSQGATSRLKSSFGEPGVCRASSSRR